MKNVSENTIFNSRRITVLLPKRYVEKVKGIQKELSLINAKRIKTYLKKHNTSLNRLTVLFLLFSAFFLSLVAYKLNEAYYAMRKERISILDKANYWQKISEEHPNFPDVYYQSAWYFYSLGYKQKAYSLLEKALVIKPDFKEAKELEERIIRE